MKYLFLISLFSCIQETELESNLNGPMQNYSYQKRWYSNSLSIKVSNDFTDEEYLEIKKAINLWNNAIGNSFLNISRSNLTSDNFTTLKSYKDQEIGIYKSYQWFEDHSPKIIALTKFYGDLYSKNGPLSVSLDHADIILNAHNYEFVLNDPYENHYHLKSVLIHELGHLLGLPHLKHPSVMRPKLMANESFDELTKDDINAIRTLYAPIQTKSKSTYLGKFEGEAHSGPLNH